MEKSYYVVSPLFFVLVTAVFRQALNMLTIAYNFLFSPFPDCTNKALWAILKFYNNETV